MSNDKIVISPRSISVKISGGLIIESLLIFFGKMVLSLIIVYCISHLRAGSMPWDFRPQSDGFSFAVCSRAYFAGHDGTSYM